MQDMRQPINRALPLTLTGEVGERQNDERSGSFISSRLLRCPILELHEAMRKQTWGEALLRYTSLVNSA